MSTTRRRTSEVNDTPTTYGNESLTLRIASAGACDCAVTTIEYADVGNAGS